MTVRGSGTPDARAPSTSPSPPPLLTHSSFLLFPLIPGLVSLCLFPIHACLCPLVPLSLSWYLSSLSFFPFSVSSPPFLSPFSLPLPRTPQLLCNSQTFTQSSGWGVQRGQSLCQSVHPHLGPHVFPGGSQQTLEAEPTQGGQREAAEAHTHRLKRTHTHEFLPFAQRHTEFLPLAAPRHAGKLKSQVWVWGAVGEGRVLGRIFCFVFFMAIYNFAFLPSAPASLAPRCVPH